MAPVDPQLGDNPESASPPRGSDSSSDSSTTALDQPARRQADDPINTAVAGSPAIGDQRILTGPIRRAVFWLALPILGEQMLNACVTWNDAFLAGRISPEATGAIGFAGYVGWLMTMMFALVGVGATAIVSRAIGSGDRAEARLTANQAFIMAIAIGLAGTAFVLAAAPGFAYLLNMRGEAATIAVDYLRIDAVGMVGASIAFVLAGCLRGAGDMRTPLVILGGVNVVNLGLSWVLTFGLGSFEGIGVNGIATGTAGARWIGAFWILAIMQRRGHGLSLRLSLMSPDRALIGRMLRVGIPAAADGAITFSGHFVYMTIVARIPTPYPVAALYAAHIVGIRIESLSYLPANAYSFAAATLVGQNLGARQPDRARRAAHESALQATLILVGSGLLYLFGAELLYRALSNDPDVWACGVPALRWMALFQLTLAPLIVYVGALRGAGDTRAPMLITILGMAFVRLPVAYFGGFVLELGLLGAWMGMYADLSVRAILMAWRFRTGRWQRIRV